MTFPLPTGTCREVCRPARINRFSQKDVVIRMAIAAVKRGNDPCDIAVGVANAVECPLSTPCTQEALQLSSSLQLFRDGLDQLLQAAIDLAEDFAWKKAGAYMPEDETSWWEDLITKLNVMARIVKITVHVVALLDSLFDVVDRAYIVITDTLALIECVQASQGGGT